MRSENSRFTKTLDWLRIFGFRWEFIGLSDKEIKEKKWPPDHSYLDWKGESKEARRSLPLGWKQKLGLLSGDHSCERNRSFSMMQRAGGSCDKAPVLGFDLWGIQSRPSRSSWLTHTWWGGICNPSQWMETGNEKRLTRRRNLKKTYHAGFDDEFLWT